MHRWLPLILCLILPGSGLAEGQPDDAEPECQSCTARHRSLQALQAARLLPNDCQQSGEAEAPGAAESPGDDPQAASSQRRETTCD